MKLKHSFKLGRRYGISYVVSLQATCRCLADGDYDPQEWEEKLPLLGFGLLLPCESYEDRSVEFHPLRAYAILFGIGIDVRLHNSLSSFFSRRQYFK